MSFISGPISWEGTEYFPPASAGASPNQVSLPDACPLAGDTRTTARAWAANFGLPPATAKASELRAIWNAVSESEAYAVVHAALKAAEGRPEPTPTPTPTPAPVTPAPEAEVSDPGNQGNKKTAKEKALEILLADAMSEERVIQLVREHAPKPDGALRIEVRTDRSPAPVVTGLVHKDFPRILDMVSSGMHLCLVGPAGTGKSHMLRTAAEAVGKRVSSTCALQSTHELLGFVTATGSYVRTPFRDAVENGDFFLWDEFDSSDARAQVKFNMVFDGSPSYAFPDGMVAINSKFQAGMSANVWNGATGEYVGRSKIDAVLTNRLARFFVDYDEHLERASMPNDPKVQRFVERCQAIRKAVAELGIKHLVTIRNMQRGAAMIESGWDMDECLTVFVRENLDNEQWNKIKTTARI